MTNAEKFKTAKERCREFEKFCGNKRCESCVLKYGLGYRCILAWLDMEADMEKILPCPCCGGECVVSSHSEGYNVNCSSRYCYIGKTFESRDEAIAAHNRVARAVMAEK